ncbi:MAG: hypothetical protein HY652_02830 [Acidobacteria bacterium]|nr:hypothetical protein [Acidobacteriota bacterium]
MFFQESPSRAQALEKTGGQVRISFRTLALPLFLERVTPPPKAFLLDLGKACGTNIQFFFHRGIRIHVSDFYSALFEHLERNSDTQVLPLASEVWAQPSHADQFDAALCWDIMDYLPVAVAADLGDQIWSAMKKGSTLWALSLSKKNPQLEPPVHFRILDEEELEYYIQPSGPLRRRFHTNSELMKIFRRFQLVHSFILQNGMRELIFSK